MADLHWDFTDQLGPEVKTQADKDRQAQDNELRARQKSGTSASEAPTGKHAGQFGEAMQLAERVVAQNFPDRPPLLPMPRLAPPDNSRPAVAYIDKREIHIWVRGVAPNLEYWEPHESGKGWKVSTNPERIARGLDAMDQERIAGRM